jgi:hypothetical protein
LSGLVVSWTRRQYIQHEIRVRDRTRQNFVIAPPRAPAGVALFQPTLNTVRAYAAYSRYGAYAYSGYVHAGCMHTSRHAGCMHTSRQCCQDILSRRIRIQRGSAVKTYNQGAYTYSEAVLSRHTIKAHTAGMYSLCIQQHTGTCCTAAGTLQSQPCSICVRHFVYGQVYGQASTASLGGTCQSSLAQTQHLQPPPPPQESSLPSLAQARRYDRARHHRQLPLSLPVPSINGQSAGDALLWQV